MMFRRLLAFFRRVPQDDAGVGAQGEDIALDFLRDLGWRLLARNVRLPGGELDLLMDIPGIPTLIVVEVKTAAGSPGPAFRPERRVTARKRNKLVRLARHAQAKHPAIRGRPLRFDVVAVELHQGRQPPTVRHYPSVFSG